jgi:hypothetical protein
MIAALEDGDVKDALKSQSSRLLTRYDELST